MNARFRLFTTLGFAVAIAITLFAYLGLTAVEPTQHDSDGFGDPDSGAIASPITSVAKLPINVPVANLYSALSELCDDDFSPEEKQALIDEYNEFPQKLVARLTVSPSAEHLHLAAILEQNPATRIELLERAIAMNPNENFLLWHAVQICAQEQDVTPCPLGDWEKRLLMFDGQNSESWIQVAANRYAAGENDAALDAMRLAATAAVSRTYWTETIEMAERGFAAASELSFSERVQMAFGVAAAIPARYSEYLTMCQEQSASNAEWAYTCLAYGELVEKQAKTEMDISLARVFQKHALEALGEVEGASALKQRSEVLQKLRLARLDSFANNYAVAARLMTSSPTLFSTYLAAFREHGEAAAIEFWMNEANRLLQERPELACNP